MAKETKPDDAELLTIDNQTVRISSPTKPYFSKDVQLAKLDIARYFIAVAPGALRGIANRPIVLKRFVNGACLTTGQPEPFYQKRAPSDLPPWMRTVTLSFPSGRTAEEVVVDTPAGLLWVVNLGCMELHPHPVSAEDLDHPNELRVDLDPNPGIEWPAVREVALVARQVLEDHHLTPFVKTSGSRGIHINCPIHPRWTFTEVRRAALALAREIERRAPQLATSKWWKEERHGVFIDYNQNAKDRTTASAYSVRPLPDARVSAPLHWHELTDANPADFTVLTMPQRFSAIGDPHATMNNHPGSLEALLDLAARDEAAGLGDAPWPPHFAKQDGEGKRVQPSKAKKEAADKSFNDQLGEGFGNKRFRKQSLKNQVTTDAQPETNGVPHVRNDGHGFPESSEEGTTAGTNNETGGRRGLQAPITDAQNERALAPEKPAKKRATRPPKHPLLTIAQSPDKPAAEAGLDRWKQKHPEAATHLAPDDILIDRMRGASQIWYRIRINLRNVPEILRPEQGTPDPDDDPTRAWREGQG